MKKSAWAWIAIGIAVSVAIIVTKSALCLWAFVIPIMWSD